MDSRLTSTGGQPVRSREVFALGVRKHCACNSARSGSRHWLSAGWASRQINVAHGGLPVAPSTHDTLIETVDSHSLHPRPQKPFGGSTGAQRLAAIESPRGKLSREIVQLLSPTVTRT